MIPYGGYQQPQGFSQMFMTTVRQIAESRVSMFVRSGQITQFAGSQILAELDRRMPEIAGYLAQTYRDTVHQDNITQVVDSYISRIVQAMSTPQQFIGSVQPQPFQSSFQQPLQPAIMGGNMGGGFSVQSQQLQPNVVSQPTTVQTQQIQAQPVQPVMVESINEPVKTINPTLKYTYNSDPEATSFSIHGKSRPVYEVTTKVAIQEEGGETYNYSNVICYIPEINVSRVLNNFHRSNQALCKGKWIAHLDYNTFEMRKMHARQCGPIDLAPMNSSDRLNLPVDATIQKVIASIMERDFSIVSVLEELFLKKFNDLLLRYVRVSSNIKLNLQVEKFDDVLTLASYRNKDLEQLTSHRNYEDTIWLCFKEAMAAIINQYTKLGYYNTKDIIPHMYSSPDFIIRQNGFCERDFVMSDEFIKIVSETYTAFSFNDSIVLSNFIPKELRGDITNRILAVTHTDNVFNSLIMSMWKSSPKTIVMKESNDDILIVKSGVTMDDKTFIYESTL